jgi:hypothetical protein
MYLNHKIYAMVACHLNFKFQVLALLKGTKELGVAHFFVDLPKIKDISKKEKKKQVMTIEQDVVAHNFEKCTKNIKLLKP